jgi:O-methyltransferase involved in polyketide biosynthesis
MSADKLSAMNGHQVPPARRAPGEQSRIATSTAGAPATALDVIDTSQPNIARVYDYYLGGKDNFAADRDLAERTLAMCPAVLPLCRDNRAFVCAVAARAARHGVSQFIDLGCGLPTHPAVHEAARAVIPGARVAYVDNDPVVIVHARALLSDLGLTAVQADLTDPEAVLADPGLREVLDLAQPTCLIMGAVLHFLPAARARSVCAAWTDRLASGSWVAISVGQHQPLELLDRMTAMYTAASVQHHSPHDVATFLDGLDLVPPGIAEAGQWQAGVAGAPPDRVLWALCAAAIKR